MNIEIHVVTCNPDPSEYIFEITDKLNIDRKKIHCVFYSLKHIFFQTHNDFVFHLDNDDLEIREINQYTKVKGILFDADWKENCLTIIGIGV